MRRRRAVLLAVLAGSLTGTGAPVALGAPEGAPAVAQDVADGLIQVAEARMCEGRIQKTATGDAEHSRTAPRGGQTHGGDLAIAGSLLVALCGNDDSDLYNDGFVLADISDPAAPRKLSQFTCVASASDLAVYGHLVFLAVDRNFDVLLKGPLAAAGKPPGCQDELQPYVPGMDDTRIFRGVRIVDISNPGSPRLVASVRANTAGAHTVTALPHRGPDGTVRDVLVFTSTPGERTQRVLRVPLAAPHEAADSVNQRDLDTSATGVLGTGCHDISFFTPDRRMVCDRLELGSIVYDLPEGLFPDEAQTDRKKSWPPYRLDGKARAVLRPLDPNARPHSSAFSYDGGVVAVSNEANTAVATNSCGPLLGAMAFYDVSRLAPAGSGGPPAYLVPVGLQHAPTLLNSHWCISANFNVVPVRDGRRLAVASWYAGGTTVIDFTDPREPRQVAHYVQDVGDEARASTTRSSYWYDGHVYVGNTHGCVTALGDASVWDRVGGAQGDGRPRLAPTCLGGTERGLEVLAIDIKKPVNAGNTWSLAEADFGRQTCRQDGKRFVCD